MPGARAFVIGVCRRNEGTTRARLHSWGRKVDRNTPKQARSRDREERIIAAAETLLLASGRQEVTVRDICAACETSASSFYARFPDRDSLLRCVWFRFEERTRASLRRLGDDEHARNNLRSFVFSLALTTIDLWNRDAHLIRRLRDAEERDALLKRTRLDFERSLITEIFGRVRDWHPTANEEALRRRLIDTMPTIAATYRGLAFQGDADVPEEFVQKWSAQRINIAESLTDLLVGPIPSLQSNASNGSVKKSSEDNPSSHFGSASPC